MSDQGFREFQLGGKQVVFLFLLGAVALVGTFLLGVSAGRGASPVDTAAQATPPPVQSTDASVMPPAITPAPGEFKYPDVLRDKDGKAATPAATPTPTAAAAAPTTSPTATPTPQPKFPGAPPPAANGAAKPAAPTHYVQVGAFSTSANAAKEVARLKGMRITASIVNEKRGNAPYKVRVGPLEKSAADALAAQLRKQGYGPSVIR